ncbi:MAG TPA: protein kinase [Polyangiaceae bacterium]
MDPFRTGPQSTDVLLGQVLAERFELQSLAGAGGMGRVYRALDRTSGAAVAVKVLPGDGDAARFAREAQVLASLDHPGIVRHVAHGVTPEGWQYLAMEWLTGEDLARHLERSAMGVVETTAIVDRAAEALAVAHRRGVVHRDLKPGNLFLVDGRLDVVKVLDFGIARTEEGGDLTASGTVMGTPAYMSPEQVRSDVIDPRADVYALGAVMFRCLVGHPPFAGAHQIAVLAKIVLEPAPLLRTILPDAPPDLEDLLARMLAKDPDARPADCDALRRELEVLGSARSARAPREEAAVTGRERRVASVVLCSRSTDDETTRPELGAETEDALFKTVRERGGVIDALARGAWIVTIPRTASPAEQAMRAVRCAVALSSARPTYPVFVATGQVLVEGAHTVGEVIDRAADALVRPSASTQAGVWIDRATAQLVEGRFRMEESADWSRVLDEVDVFAPVRMLLGRPTPCVGREPQVAMLTAMLQSVVDQRQACATVVTAPPGIGKTHLVHEFLRANVAPRRDLDLLVARGDATRASSPLALAGQLVRRAAGIVDADGEHVREKKLAALVDTDLPAGDRRRMRELLGEIAGIPTSHDDASPALRAARTEPAVMADAVRETFGDWMGARAARHTLVLLVEDLHWADARSLALLEEALLAQADAPIFLLATSRPGAVPPWTRLRAGGLVDISLAPLSPAASEALVRSALGPSVDDAVVRSLARRAAGHPFHLEELIRAVSEGRGADALPDSVLGMLQSRFDGLDTLARRALRAASVFGETFWSGGVAALLGGEASVEAVGRCTRSLVEGELVTRQRSSRWAKQDEYRFRHALLRDAAYATLTDADRVRAHRHAAPWLEDVGEDDPAVLAEHHDRGGEPERAAGFYAAAAERALKQNDLERAMTHARRARDLGPSERAAATLCAVEAEVLYWRGELAGAAERGADAAARAERGSRGWFEATSVTIGALGQLGRNDDVATRLEEASAVAPSDPDARGAQVVTLARGMTQLFWAHHGGGLSAVRTRLDALEGEGSLDALPMGWVRRVRGESAWLHEHDVDRCLAELSASCARFEEAHAMRALCLTWLNAASLTGWAGSPDEGLALVARARAEATRLRADFLLRYGATVEGLLLTYAGHPDAEARMGEALGHVAGSPRLAFICHVVLGWLALERDDADRAAALASEARAMPVARELRPAGIALAARARHARGDDAEAVALAREAVAAEGETGDLELTWGMAGVALAEASLGRDPRAARDALANVTRRLDAVAATIASAEGRERFWQRPLPNALARDLAAKLAR